MKFNDKLITAIAAIVVGVLFIALKGDVLSIAFTVLGAALIVMGILDAAKKDSKSGTVKIVAGLVTVLLGWTLVSITLYIVAALMILYCLMNLVSSLKTDGYSMSTVQKLRTYAKPVIGLAAGICLLLNQGGTVSWVFIFTGIVFIAEGIMMLAECKNNSLLKGEHKIESETERKIKESLSAVLPITGIVLMLSIFLVPMELGSIVMFLTGAVMLIVGMGFSSSAQRWR